MFQIGEVFYLDVAYDDVLDESKVRPVIVIDKRDDNIFLVSTTSQEPKNPPSYFDGFKIPILNWRRIGFKEPSWVKGYRIIQLSEQDLKRVNKKDYIGYLREKDFDFLINEIERLHS